MGSGESPLGSLRSPLSMPSSCIQIALTKSEVLTLRALALIKAKAWLQLPGKGTCAELP